MKVKDAFKKTACNMSASALTHVAKSVATKGCYFIFFQPKAPENLKDFSRNK